MRKNMKWKALLIAVVVVVFGWSMYPPEEEIKLGLDLRGGIHLIMKVITVDALLAVTDETVEGLSDLLDEESISFQAIETDEPGKVRVNGLDINKDQEFRSLVQERREHGVRVREVVHRHVGARGSQVRRRARPRPDAE